MLHVTCLLITFRLTMFLFFEAIFVILMNFGLIKTVCRVSLVTVTVRCTNIHDLFVTSHKNRFTHVICGNIR